MPKFVTPYIISDLLANKYKNYVLDELENFDPDISYSFLFKLMIYHTLNLILGPLLFFIFPKKRNLF